LADEASEEGDGLNAEAVAIFHVNGAQLGEPDNLASYFVLNNYGKNFE
jgi:hypothetical protein